MSRDLYTQQHEMTWQGIRISVAFAPSYFGGLTAHLELHSEGTVPLPMTTTGYRSHFIPCGHIEALGGPLAYVEAWLAREAASPAWREYQANAGQLALF